MHKEWSFATCSPTWTWCSLKSDIAIASRYADLVEARRPARGDLPAHREGARRHPVHMLRDPNMDANPPPSAHPQPLDPLNHVQVESSTATAKATRDRYSAASCCRSTASRRAAQQRLTPPRAANQPPGSFLSGIEKTRHPIYAAFIPSLADAGGVTYLATSDGRAASTANLTNMTRETP